MYKILVSDKFSELGLEVFEKAEGVQVDYKPGLSAEELAGIIGQYHGLAIRSGTTVTAELLEKATNLRVVGRAGTGVDNVDLKAATKKGVCVMNTPGGNTVTTAEHAIAMMLSMARKIPAACASLKGGKWEKSKFQGTEIFRKTLGVLGLGQIGRVVADRGLGLKMRVIAYDPFVSDDQAKKLGVEKVELDELFERSDFITIHVPKMPETENLINKDTIAKMKKGVRIINCARGGIVDEAALLDGLKSGQVAGAALDVFATEPVTEHPLFAVEDVVVTPHLGASTAEAQDNVAVAVAEQMVDYLVNDVVANAVNVPSVSKEVLAQIGPYIVLGERLGAMQAQLSHELPKKLSIIYGGDLNDQSTDAIGVAVLKGFGKHFSGDDVNFVNARHIAEEHGLSVQEISQKHAYDFTSSLTVKVTYPSGDERSLSGVNFGPSGISLTRYNDKILSIEPEGHVLIIRNKDEPGVVGLVGTLLGEAGVNIGNLRLARDQQGERAMTFVTTDQAVPDELIAKLESDPKIESAKRVEL